MISIPRETLQILLDTVSSCLDAGSGFFDDEQADAIAYLATALGIEPLTVLPSNHRCRYRRFHSVLQFKAWRKDALVTYCGDCNRSFDIDFDSLELHEYSQRKLPMTGDSNVS